MMRPDPLRAHHARRRAGSHRRAPSDRQPGCGPILRAEIGRWSRDGERVDAGIVDQDVEPAPFRDHLADDRVDLVRCG